MTVIFDNSKEVKRWFADRGDETHSLKYNLTENCNIMDFGGYTGVWAEKMIKLYNPNVYVIEPIKQYYDIMKQKFSTNSKVRLLNVGIGASSKKDTIFKSDDGSSQYIEQGEEIEIDIKSIEDIFKMFNVSNVDLLQINIEGAEYDVLESMIKTKFINKIKNLQIQFHNIENCVERRKKIQNNLYLNGYAKKYDYSFVWESWEKIV